MSNLKILLGTMLLAGTFGVTGCAVHTVHDHGYGPPPHAPAHGYRYHYQHHDLVYDANLGVYLLAGLTAYYFLDGIYYHHRHDGWYSSRYFDRDWRPDKFERLPPGLAKKYRNHDRDRGPGRH